MFKNDDNKSTETIIGASVHVEGDLASQGDIVVEGAINGTITTTGNLTIGAGAQVTANVQAANAYIAGRLKGNLTVAERLELAPTSRISGDVATKVLVVSDGAQLDGRCQMGATSTSTTVRANTKRSSTAAAESAG